MSVPVHTPQKASGHEVSRATAAYRTAELMDRSSRRSEWQRLCEADGTRKNTKVFSDLFSRDLEDGEVTETVDPSEPIRREHRVRSAYLLAAVFVGVICLLAGSFVGI